MFVRGLCLTLALVLLPACSTESTRGAAEGAASGAMIGAVGGMVASVVLLGLDLPSPLLSVWLTLGLLLDLAAVWALKAAARRRHSLADLRRRGRVPATLFLACVAATLVWTSVSYSAVVGGSAAAFTTALLCGTIGASRLLDASTVFARPLAMPVLRLRAASTVKRADGAAGWVAAALLIVGGWGVVAALTVSPACGAVTIGAQLAGLAVWADAALSSSRAIDRAAAHIDGGLVLAAWIEVQPHSAEFVPGVSQRRSRASSASLSGRRTSTDDNGESHALVQAAQALSSRRRSYNHHSTRNEQPRETMERCECERALRLVAAEAEFALASLAAHEAEALFLSLLASCALERRRRAVAQADEIAQASGLLLRTEPMVQDASGASALQRHVLQGLEEWGAQRQRRRELVRRRRQEEEEARARRHLRQRERRRTTTEGGNPAASADVAARGPIVEGSAGGVQLSAAAVRWRRAGRRVKLELAVLRRLRQRQGVRRVHSVEVSIAESMDTRGIYLDAAWTDPNFPPAPQSIGHIGSALDPLSSPVACSGAAAEEGADQGRASARSTETCAHASHGGTSAGAKVIWRRAAQIFASPTVCGPGGFGDVAIRQGALGDCWLLSAAAVVAQRPELMDRVFEAGDCSRGSVHPRYRVRLFQETPPMLS